MSVKLGPILTDRYILRMFEHRVFKRMYNPKEDGENSNIRCFVICTVHHVIIRIIR
jgi:hypothetical protein